MKPTITIRWSNTMGKWIVEKSMGNPPIVDARFNFDTTGIGREDGQTIVSALRSAGFDNDSINLIECVKEADYEKIATDDDWMELIVEYMGNAMTFAEREAVALKANREYNNISDVRGTLYYYHPVTKTILSQYNWDQLPDDVLESLEDFELPEDDMDVNINMEDLGMFGEAQYGDKRDYPKIDIFVDGEYKATTTWAKDTQTAVAKYTERNPEAAGKVTARLQHDAQDQADAEMGARIQKLRSQESQPISKYRAMVESVVEKAVS